MTRDSKAPQLLLTAAWLIHIAAWFSPVMKGGVTLPKGLPGWEAFMVATNACFSTTASPAWYFRPLCGLSSLSTILFVLISPWILWRGSTHLHRLSAWIAASAFIVNTHWFFLLGSDRADLRIGYYLWWGSFLVLSAGLFALAGQSQPEPLAKAHSA